MGLFPISGIFIRNICSSIVSSMCIVQTCVLILKFVDKFTVLPVAMNSYCLAALMFNHNFVKLYDWKFYKLLHANVTLLYFYD